MPLVIIEILKQSSNGIDRPMANYTIRCLHPWSLIFVVNSGRIGDLIGQFHHVNTKEMLVVHARAQSVSVGIGSRIAAQVLEHA